MAINLDRNLLDELGLGSLPENEKGALLNHVYETLEMRVGMRLADQMSNEQLDEFEKYFEAKDDAGAFSWLETNFPNYKEIVQDEFNKLKEEVRQTAPQILQASAQQAAPDQVQAAPGFNPGPVIANPQPTAQPPLPVNSFQPPGSSQPSAATPPLPPPPPQAPFPPPPAPGSQPDPDGRL